MKRSKLAVVTTMMLLGSFALVADDFGSEGFSDDSGFGGFGGDSSESAIVIEGDVNITASSYMDDELDSSVEFDPEASITLGYTGSVADVTLVTDMTTDEVTVDELYTNIYFDKFNVEAGLLKTVWGKGDKLHVVDVLNSTDFSDYFREDYLESKKASTMIKVNVPMGMSGMLEVAYLPILDANTYATEGVWTPADVTAGITAIETAVTAGAATAYQDAYNYYTTVLSADAATAGSYATLAEYSYASTYGDSDYYYPYTYTLEYGQAGARFTGTLGSFDLGVLYYFGYDKEPTLNMADTSDVTTWQFEYERMHMFGFELGKVLGPLNLRAEGAYYLMDESDDSLNYLAGFDVNIPVNNVNLNVQLKGNYMLDSDEDNANLLVAKLSDNYNHEKIEASVTGFVYLEDQDFLIKPELSTKIGDTAKVELSSGLFLGDDDTTFGQYDDNDYISLNVNYMF